MSLSSAIPVRPHRLLVVRKRIEYANRYATFLKHCRLLSSRTAATPAGFWTANSAAGSRPKRAFQATLAAGSLCGPALLLLALALLLLAHNPAQRVAGSVAAQSADQLQAQQRQQLHGRAHHQLARRHPERNEIRPAPASEPGRPLRHRRRPAGGGSSSSSSSQWQRQLQVAREPLGRGKQQRLRRRQQRTEPAAPYQASVVVSISDNSFVSASPPAATAAGRHRQWKRPASGAAAATSWAATSWLAYKPESAAANLTTSTTATTTGLVSEPDEPGTSERELSAGNSIESHLTGRASQPGRLVFPGLPAGRQAGSTSDSAEPDAPAQRPSATTASSKSTSLHNANSNTFDDKEPPLAASAHFLSVIADDDDEDDDDDENAAANEDDDDDDDGDDNDDDDDDGNDELELELDRQPELDDHRNGAAKLADQADRHVDFDKDQAGELDDDQNDDDDDDDDDDEEAALLAAEDGRQAPERLELGGQLLVRHQPVRHQMAPVYSNLIVSPHNELPSTGRRLVWRGPAPAPHLASIRLVQGDASEYPQQGGLNSAIVAILFGLGVTGMIVMIVGMKMRSIRQRLAHKGRRRSLVPHADFLIKTIPIQ